jgi:hypothetical protein
MKKMSFFQYVAIFFSLFLGLGIALQIAACGGDDDDDNDSVNSEASDDSGETDSSEDVESDESGDDSSQEPTSDTENSAAVEEFCSDFATVVCDTTKECASTTKCFPVAIKQYCIAVSTGANEATLAQADKCTEDIQKTPCEDIATMVSEIAAGDFSSVPTSCSAILTPH